MHKGCFAIVAGAIFSLTGCGIWQPRDIVPRPTSISIVDAVSQIRQAIVKASVEANQTGLYSGYYPCTATAVVNVTAGAQNSNQLVLDASIKPPSPAAPSIGLSNTYATSSSASVGNQITITLVSSLCLPGSGDDGKAADKGSAEKGAAAKGATAGSTSRPPELLGPPPRLRLN
jgi:hypothetical protein